MPLQSQMNIISAFNRMQY